jgi:serine acetyltransferase
MFVTASVLISPGLWWLAANCRSLTSFGMTIVFGITIVSGMTIVFAMTIVVGMTIGFRMTIVFRMTIGVRDGRMGDLLPRSFFVAEELWVRFLRGWVAMLPLVS